MCYQTSLLIDGLVSVQRANTVAGTASRLGMGSDQTLQRLLGEIATGDRAAFRRLYDLEAGRLYGVALRIVRTPALAADVLQEAFLQIWQNAGRYEPSRGTVEGWLIGIVRLRAIDALRRSTREIATDDPTLGDSPHLDPDQALEALNFDADARSLQRCLSELDNESRHCILLAYVEGYSQTEIAKRVGAPLGTVKSWARRGLIALRGCLEQ